MYHQRFLLSCLNGIIVAACKTRNLSSFKTFLHKIGQWLFPTQRRKMSDSNDSNSFSGTQHFEFCSITKTSEKNSRIFGKSTKVYKFKFNKDNCYGQDPEEILLSAFSDVGRAIVLPGHEQNFFRFCFEANTLTTPASTCILQGFNYAADVMIDVLVHIAQSGRDLFADEGLKLYVEEIENDNSISTETLKRFQVSLSFQIDSGNKRAKC